MIRNAEAHPALRLAPHPADAPDRPIGDLPADGSHEGSWLGGLLALVVANAAVLAISSALLPEHASSILASYASPFVRLNGWNLAMSLAGLTACLLVEMACLGWERCALRRLLWPSRSARHDLFAGLISLGGFTVVLFLFFTAGIVPVAAGEARWLVAMTGIRPIESPVLQLAVTFLVREFLAYWFHRALHTWAFAWEIHKYHHAATEMNMLTSLRSHVIETAMGYALITLPLVFLGITGETFVVLTIVGNVTSRFNHSMLAWDYGWWGRWLLVSPVTHRIHHSPLPEHWDKNYSNLLVFWDRLFGTWYDGDVVNTEVGVSDNQLERVSVLGGYIQCYQRFLTQLMRSLVTNEWLLATRRARQQAETKPQPQPTATNSDDLPIRRAA